MNLLYLQHFAKILQNALILILLILTVHLQSQNNLEVSNIERALNCSAVITSYPYSESFESGIGSWTQSNADDFDWTRKSGRTNSSGTGPSSANDGSWYMYTESSSPNYPSKVAIFISPCFDLTSLSNPVFGFDYHMFGSSMGALDLQLSTDGLTWITVWNLSGNQGNSWFSANIDLTAFSIKTVQFKFIAKTASSYRSDIAIDNIVVNGTSSCGGGIASFPYTKGFEAGLGTWTQSNTDDFDWTFQSNGTGSSGTGPSSASEGTQYIYTESSSPNYPSKEAILTSPCFDLSGLNNSIITFDYHMYGASMGTLDLQISNSSGAFWTSVWSLSGNQGNSWQNAVVDLSRFDGTSISLRLVATTSTSWQSDMAIDNIDFSGTSLLPVEMLTFYGTENEAKNHQLFWQTATELNNSHFILERSADAIHFETIGQIAGNGTSNNLNNYSFIVDEPLSGANYYRLQQVDFDGTTAYTKIVQINSSERLIKTLDVYPNPTNRSISLHGLEQFDDSDAVIKVLDIQGNVLISQPYISTNGDFVELELESLTKGYYLVVVYNSAIIATTNFLKQ